MYIMTRNGYQPLYEPKPTWAMIGTASDKTRKGVRFTFEYFRGHEEAAMKHAAVLSAKSGCDVEAFPVN